MSCPDCTNTKLPPCTGEPMLICVRKEADPFPIHAWAVATTCVSGIPTVVSLFSDEAATIPLAGYGLGDQIPCTQDFENVTAPLLDQIQRSENAVQSSIEVAADAITDKLDNPINYRYPAFTSNGNGDLTSITRQDPVTLQTWVKTITYVGDVRESVSEWVLQ